MLSEKKKIIKLLEQYAIKHNIYVDLEFIRQKMVLGYIDKHNRVNIVLDNLMFIVMGEKEYSVDSLISCYSET